METTELATLNSEIVEPWCEAHLQINQFSG